MNTWIIAIVSGILVWILTTFITMIFKPWPVWLLGLIKNKNCVIEYKFRDKKIIKFPTKENTRISVGVLACIENKDGKLLLIKKGRKNGRRDNFWKPLGGVIKISNKIKKQFNKHKLDYEFESNTKYAAKQNDLRIKANIKNNKIINKVIYSETNKFYISELTREIMEELEISKKDFEKLFTIDKKPISMNSWFRTKSQSPLRENDYLHQIIYNVKIKDVNSLKQQMNKIKKLKWIDLQNSGKEELAITCYWLKERNKFKPFKTNVINFNFSLKIKLKWNKINKK